MTSRFHTQLLVHLQNLETRDKGEYLLHDHEDGCDTYYTAPRSLTPIDYCGNQKGKTQSPNACIIMKNHRPMCWSEGKGINNIGIFPKATKFRLHNGMVEYHEETERKGGGKWCSFKIEKFKCGTIHSI